MGGRKTHLQALVELVDGLLDQGALGLDFPNTLQVLFQTGLAGRGSVFLCVWGWVGGWVGGWEKGGLNEVLDSMDE